jgi:AAA ATPase domain
MPRSTLFGREAELDFLGKLIAGAADGGGAVVLRGEAGIGKSALLVEAMEGASARGMNCLPRQACSQKHNSRLLVSTSFCARFSTIATSCLPHRLSTCAVGATIMGRNMFGGGPGRWGADPSKGFWGANPPHRHPVFVLTRHPRGPRDGGRNELLLRSRQRMSIESTRSVETDIRASVPDRSHHLGASTFSTRRPSPRRCWTLPAPVDRGNAKMLGGALANTAHRELGRATPSCRTS